MSARKGTNICEFAQHGVIYKSICNTICVTCEYMHVYKQVLSVSTRKGTNICEFAQHGFMYKTSLDTIYIYTYNYVNYF